MTQLLKVKTHHIYKGQDRSARGALGLFSAVEKMAYVQLVSLVNLLVYSTFFQAFLHGGYVQMTFINVQ